MAQGTVKWFNPDKGYGFIAPDDGTADVFVHHSAIDMGGYRTLAENQKVEYTVSQGPKGPQADQVHALWLTVPWQALRGAGLPRAYFPLAAAPVVNWLLMRAQPVYYSFKIGLNLLLLAVGWTAFALLGLSWWQMLAVVFLAVMFTQTGFIGHHAGHRQISGSKRLDGLIGRIHGNLLIGLSYG